MSRFRRSSSALRLRHLAFGLAITLAAAGCLPAALGAPSASSSPSRPAPSSATVHPPASRPAPTASRPTATHQPTSVPAATATPEAPVVTPSDVPSATPAPTATPAPGGTDVQAGPTLAQLVGQRLVVSMSGTTPTTALLGRIRRGEIGGVILFGDNIVNETQLRALTAKLHAAAVAGGQPRLLVMTDQEGGAIRRLPWAPPVASARQMGEGTASAARTKGDRTGLALHAVGIDVDLAPVADVPRTTSSFMWLDQRTFGFDPLTVSSRSNAFALGLRDGQTLATMKHFPGIGRATKNTDLSVVSIPASLATLTKRDLIPYTKAIANRIPLIMLSNANYPSLDAANGAGWSRAITRTLLRVQLGFRGVTITDSLTAAAQTRGVSVASIAIKAAVAGTDMLLVQGSETSTATLYGKLLQAAQSQVIPATRLQASYNRILALKAGR